MATCNPSELIANAACFQCLSNKELKAVIAQLLCNLSGSTGDNGNVVLSDNSIGGLYYSFIASIKSISLPNCVAVTTDSASFGAIIVESLSNLTSFSAPNLTDCLASDGATGFSFEITSCNALTSINLDALATTFGGLNITSNPLLTSISLPSLTTLGFDSGINSNPALVSISLPLLADVFGSFNLANNPSLVALSLPDLGTVLGEFNAQSNSALTSFSAPNWTISNTVSSTVNFNGDALDQASVDAILSRGVASGLNVGMTIDLSGGTNSPPTGGALNADYLILTGNGVNVFINP